MRKFLFSLLCFFGVMLSASAQDQPSSFSIRMWDNSFLSVSLGANESSRFSRTYNVRSLPGGHYTLRVSRRATLTAPASPVFDGSIEIPPATRVQAVLQQNGTLEVSVLEDYVAPVNPLSFRRRTEQVHTSSSGTGEAAARQTLIEPLELQSFRNTLSAAPDDHARQSLAIEGLNSHTFTTSNISSLAPLFTNETSRLEFIKSGYTRVVDPENYFQLKYFLTRIESRVELDRYMEANASRAVHSAPAGNTAP